MIIGLGTDITDAERFRDIDTPEGDRLRTRLFTPAEQDYCRTRPQPALHYAARFAAKEALSKAFGTGIARGIRWIDVEVLRAEDGRPSILLHGEAELFARRLGVDRIHLSISHSHGSAVATVILEGSSPE
jgi:holo-[acyl-carrier protein] synthase